MFETKTSQFFILENEPVSIVTDFLDNEYNSVMVGIRNVYLDEENESVHPYLVFGENDLNFDLNKVSTIYFVKEDIPKLIELLSNFIEKEN